MRAAIPWKTAHQQGTPGCKPGEPHFPQESGVCPAQIHLPCPPPTASRVGCAQPAQGHQSHNTPLCQGIFSKCSQTLCGIHGEILPSSGQSSILDSTAAQKHRCHLCHCSPSTPYTCWLPLGVAVHTSTALLPAQVLTYAFRGSPAPLKKPWTLLLSLQCLWVLKNRY